MLFTNTLNMMFSRMEDHKNALDELLPGRARLARLEEQNNDLKIFLIIAADLAIAVEEFVDGPLARPTPLAADPEDKADADEDKKSNLDETGTGQYL